jgi:hypothetical protein
MTSHWANEEVREHWIWKQARRQRKWRDNRENTKFIATARIYSKLIKTTCHWIRQAPDLSIFHSFLFQFAENLVISNRRDITRVLWRWKDIGRISYSTNRFRTRREC